MPGTIRGARAVEIVGAMLLSSMPGRAIAERAVIQLYQVGANGRYCVSMTQDTSGCISGTDAQGRPINVLDQFRGHYIEFYNISDAPHDMHFTGANGGSMPAQRPGDAAVNKQLVYVDETTQMVTCSFHGNQLGFGYKVKEMPQAGGEMGGGSGHQGGATTPSAIAGGGGGGEPSRPITYTKPADVGGEIVAKGMPEEVQNLVMSRPELMNALKEVRPLLAEEVAQNLAQMEAAGLVAEGAASAVASVGAGGLDGSAIGSSSAGGAMPSSFPDDGKGLGKGGPTLASNRFIGSKKGSGVGDLGGKATGNGLGRIAKVDGKSPVKEGDWASDFFGTGGKGGKDGVGRPGTLVASSQLIAGNSGVFGGQVPAGGAPSGASRGVASAGAPGDWAGGDDPRLDLPSSWQDWSDRVTDRWPWLLVGILLLLWAASRSKRTRKEA